METRARRKKPQLRQEMSLPPAGPAGPAAPSGTGEGPVDASEARGEGL